MSIYSFTAEELEEIRRADYEIDHAIDMERRAGNNKLMAQRMSLGLSQRQLAENLGVTQTTISAWETGRSPIRWDMLAPFGITEDFDVDRYLEEYGVSNDDGEMLCRYREKLGMSRVDFAAKIGVLSETIRRWETGKRPVGWRRLAQAGITKEDVYANQA